MPAPPEIRLALFGTSNSGKTTFLASYFGNQQRHAFENLRGYRLEEESTARGNILLCRYYQMEEKGSFPNSTNKFEEYRFNFKVKDLPDPCVRIVWYDYPGGWWVNDPNDEEERLVRREALVKLLTSHVGVLLIDGALIASNRMSLVKQQFDQFRNEIQRIKDYMASEGSPLAHGSFPSQWIIAISKADLLPSDQTAERVGKSIVMAAADQMAGVATAVDSARFGHQFLLLSSVRGDQNCVLDAHSYMGLPLFAPLALMSVLDELAREAEGGSGWGVLSALTQRLAAIVDLIDQLDNFLPEKYQPLTKLLQALALKEGLDKGEDYFRKKQRDAAHRGLTLAAAAAAMRAELASDESQRLCFRTQ